MDNLYFIECSFCGYKPSSTKDLVIGPRQSICKDCVESAANELGLIEAATADARKTIEDIAAAETICIDCECDDEGPCRVHSITREWMRSHPIP